MGRDEAESNRLCGSFTWGNRLADHDPRTDTSESTGEAAGGRERIQGLPRVTGELHVKEERVASQEIIETDSLGIRLPPSLLGKSRGKLSARIGPATEHRNSLAGRVCWRLGLPPIQKPMRGLRRFGQAKTMRRITKRKKLKMRCRVAGLPAGSAAKVKRP
jgi:hypothetical protein